MYWHVLDAAVGGPDPGPGPVAVAGNFLKLSRSYGCRVAPDVGLFHWPK